MSIFDERKARDVKLHKRILPACRFLKVTGVRGHSKPTVTKRLAKAFIDRRYVVISSQIIVYLFLLLNHIYTLNYLMRIKASI